MFRRFMIVCWMLFGILGAIGSVIWVNQWRTDSEIQQYTPSLIRDAYEAIDHFNWVIEQEEATIAAGEEAIRRIRAGTWTATTTEEEVLAKIAERERYVKPFREKKEALSRLARKRNDLRRLKEMSFATATAVLLWNIIWHICHWVWMGRNIKG